MLEDDARSTEPGAPTHDAYARTRHFPALDGLRGLAVLMVLVYHCPRLLVPGVEHLQRAGDAGVDIFFVLSGFLITMLLLRDRGEVGASTPGLLGRFYVKRVLRIFPLYYLAIALYWLKVQASPDPLAAGLYADALPYLLTYTIDASLGWGDTGFPAFGIAWSLGVEEKFYLFWPLLVLLLKPRHVLYAGVAIIGATLLWRGWLVSSYTGDLTARLYYPFDVRMDGIMWGCVVACLLHDPKTYGATARLLGRPWVLAAGAALFASAAVTMTNDSFWRYLALPLGASFVIGAAAASRADRRGFRPFCTRPMRFLGRISYGMYVFHPLAISVVTTLIGTQGFAPRAACVLAATGLTVVVATASFRWFERPILRLRQRVEPRPQPAALPVV
ncbi:MAG: acyltransferase family protein [Planctomycetota bacterium]|jgi:peptidoglycan/LPS O-acetylase OafA/YrhL